MGDSFYFGFILGLAICVSICAFFGSPEIGIVIGGIIGVALGVLFMTISSGKMKLRSK